jgi:arylsulfatase A-like enzyme
VLRIALLVALSGIVVAAAARGVTTEPRQAAGVAQRAAPRLVVIVVVDQLRFDYLDRFAGLWKHGFRRLMTEGAVFERAFYPYLNTVTCTGHATIATGALPSTHGVILNEWWQRSANRRMSCTDDPSVKSVPYGGGQPERIGHSAIRLRTKTLAERLRERTPASRIVALSMKPRSTVMLAGHGGTAVTWFADTNTWATSTAFTTARVPQVQEFVAANPVEAERPLIWDRLLDRAAYTMRDDGIGERPKLGWSVTFPHPISGVPGTAEAQFYELWERSPMSDAYLGRMASALIKSMQLGQRGAVDFLGVSFSAVDYVGHDFGPDSQEVLDTLVRLDQTLGSLFEALDAAVGRDQWVVGLSADHGVAPIPEQWQRQGGDAGRVVNAAVRKVAEAAMVEAHGPGPHVAHVEYSTIYLTEPTRRLVAAKPEALRPLIDAVSRINGILRVLPAAGLEAARASADPIERAAAISYFPGESGEVVLAMKPYWINTDTSAATHGTLHPYDQHVPVIVMGAPFKAGRYSHAATPADLAPTLAATIELAMRGVDGRVLSEALR